MSSDDLEFFGTHFSDYCARIKVIAKLDMINEVFTSTDGNDKEFSSEVSGVLKIFNCSMGDDFSAVFFNTFKTRKEAENWHKHLSDNRHLYLLVEGFYSIFFKERRMFLFDPQITPSERAISPLEPYNFRLQLDGV